MYTKNLVIERNKRKESQEDIAEVLKTTQQQISKYERGVQELPIHHLITLCEHWNISADYLLGVRTSAEVRKIVK